MWYFDAMLIGRYLDPKNDQAFKKIFGQEKHKNIPIAFLNAALGLKTGELIEDLEFLDGKQPPEVAFAKESLVDVIVRDQKKTRYIVEMQIAKVEGFEKRAQYYAAKAYISHFKQGDQYADLSKVIFLAITDFVLFPKKESYKSDHVILDNKTFEHDLKDFSFTFVELPKFTKGLEDLHTVEEQWYYFLKTAPQDPQAMGDLSQNREIREAWQVLARHLWNQDDLLLYEEAWLKVSDEKGMIAAAKQEGIKEGRVKGLEEGRAKGLEDGRKEGQKKERIAVAISLLRDHFPLAAIVKHTGLTPEEIEQLKSP